MPHLAITIYLVGLHHSVVSTQWQCHPLWWLKQITTVTRTGIKQKVSQRACLWGVLLNRLTQMKSPALTVGGTFPRAEVSVWIKSRKWAEHQHSLYPGLDWRCSVTNCFKLLCRDCLIVLNSTLKLWARTNTFCPKLPFPTHLIAAIRQGTNGCQCGAQMHPCCLTTQLYMTLRNSESRQTLQIPRRGQNKLDVTVFVVGCFVCLFLSGQGFSV